MTNTKSPALLCSICGNDKDFDATKTYLHKVMLDATGQVISSRVHSDLEDQEMDITCRRCARPVYFPDPQDGSPVDTGPSGHTSTKNDIEAALRKIDARREEIMDLLENSRDLSMQAAEDIGVAAGAITDAISEIREAFDEHGL